MSQATGKCKIFHTLTLKRYFNVILFTFFDLFLYYYKCVCFLIYEWKKSDTFQLVLGNFFHSPYCSISERRLSLFLELLWFFFSSARLKVHIFWQVTRALNEIQNKDIFSILRHYMWIGSFSKTIHITLNLCHLIVDILSSIFVLFAF